MAALEMLAEMLEARFSKAGPVIGCAPSNCGGCPFACSLRQQTGEFRSGSVLTVNNLAEVPSEFKGRITFYDSLSQISSEFPIKAIKTSEQICSECNKPASTCSHRKF